MNNESTPFYKMDEFWIAVVDALVAITLQIIELYAPGETLELVQFIVAQVQPIIVMIIVSMLGARVAAALRTIAADALSEFAAKARDV